MYRREVALVGGSRRAHRARSDQEVSSSQAYRICGCTGPPALTDPRSTIDKPPGLLIC